MRSMSLMRPLALVMTGLMTVLTGWLAVASPQSSLNGRGDMAARLEALRPDRAMAYFELAEEVADAATTDEDRLLARHLFGLAGVLDSSRLGRSACLALADMSADAQEKRRLLSLAWLLPSPGQGRSIGATSMVGPAEPPSTSAVLALTDAFSYYRKGEGTRALNELRKPGAMDLLEQYSRRVPGGHEGFLTDCRLYRERIGPSLTSMQVRRMLELEATLLAGEDRSWSGELLLTDGQPLIEVDPHRLEWTLGVDGDRPYYRGGRWVASP